SRGDLHDFPRKRGTMRIDVDLPRSMRAARCVRVGPPSLTGLDGLDVANATIRESTPTSSMGGRGPPLARARADEHSPAGVVTPRGDPAGLNPHGSLNQRDVATP